MNRYELEVTSRDNWCETSEAKFSGLGVGDCGLKVEQNLRPVYAHGQLTVRDNIPFLITAFFWVITQRVVVIPYRHFGSTYGSHLQRS